jgi:hypothetical protein
MLNARVSLESDCAGKRKWSRSSRKGRPTSAGSQVVSPDALTASDAQYLPELREQLDEGVRLEPDADCFLAGRAHQQHTIATILHCAANFHEKEEDNEWERTRKRLSTRFKCIWRNMKQFGMR